MKLSIILPVYKVEKYLRKCLDSCLHQDMRSEDYEIICVNDGSPDNCDQILDEYVAKNSNVRVITQENQGLSMARNNGLAVAKGEYVWFVDSDDWIEENCLSGINKSLEKKTDILQINYQKVEEKDRSVVKVFGKYDENVMMSGKEVIVSGGLPSAAQFSIYRREFLMSNNLKFAEGRLHEDIEFKPRATFLAKKIAWHTPIVYNYLLRTSGSIMRTFKLKNGEDILYAIRSISCFKDLYAKDELSKKSFNDFIGKYFNSVMKVYFSLHSNERHLLKRMIIEEPSLFVNMIRASKSKYRIQGLIFKTSFLFGAFLLKLTK